MCWFRAIPSCRGLRCLILNRSFSSPAVSTGDLDRKCWQVSSHGRCCSTRGIISYGSVKPSGYSVVRICNTDLFVHRLVAFAFLGPPADKKCVGSTSSRRWPGQQSRWEFRICYAESEHTPRLHQSVEDMWWAADVGEGVVEGCKLTGLE